MHPDLYPNEISFATCHSYADAIGTCCLPDAEEDTEMEEVEISRNNDHSYCVNVNNTDEETNMGEIRPGKNKTKKRKIVGLLANEINLLHLLDKGMVSTILEEMEMGILDEDATSTELLSFVMLNDKCKVIPDMISQLQYYNGTKWGDT